MIALILGPLTLLVSAACLWRAYRRVVGNAGADSDRDVAPWDGDEERADRWGW